MIIQGSPQHPVQLNDHFFGPKIKEVHWGGLIGVLIVDFPEGIRFLFDPFSFHLMHAKAVGDVISKQDFATFTDETGEHHAQVSELVRPKIELSTLYGEGDRHWKVSIIMSGYGEDPGKHVDPSPFPPDLGIPPNSFPNPIWAEYRDNYNAQKARWLAMPQPPLRRWVESSNLAAIGSDTLTSGVPNFYFGPGETWAELNFGLVNLSYHYLAPYDPPQFNLFGVQQYQTLYSGDIIVSGVTGYASNFDFYEPRRPAPWGLGEEEVAGNPGRKAIRQIYFFDFKEIGDQVISVSMIENGPDERLVDYGVKFRFLVLSQSSRFTLTQNLFTVDHQPGFDQTKTFPYTQTGVLFRIGKRGFVT